MTEEEQTKKQETLGEFLVRQRQERGMSFADILQETKIPIRSLQAMEADDYQQLPADAFARGFYGLYAKHLGLNPADLLQRFEKERTKKSRSAQVTATTKQIQKVNTMAARPSMTTSSMLSFSLVIIIAVIALGCWYFSWNPAAYLSEKLRSFQVTASPELQQVENPQMPNSVGYSDDGNAVDSKHFLTIDFLEETTITVSIDNGLPEKEVYAKGSTRSWYASAKVSLILPDSANVRVFFDGSNVELPQSHNGLISIELP